MTVTVNDWSANQPNNNGEECVVMKSDEDFKWNDVLCTAASAYVCKVPAVCPTGNNCVLIFSILNEFLLHLGITKELCGNNLIYASKVYILPKNFLHFKT